MGIQINGNTDTISASDGSLVVAGAELPSVSTLSVGTGGTAITTTNAGRVGIGTTNPGEKLVVYGPIAIGATNTFDLTAFTPSRVPIRIVNDNNSLWNGGGMINESYGSSVGQPGYVARFARGTAASPSGALAGDRLAFLVGSGFGTASFINSGAINIRAEENFTDSSAGAYINFETCSIGFTGRTEKVRITANGSLLVGSNSLRTNIGTLNEQVLTQIEGVGIGATFTRGRLSVINNSSSTSAAQIIMGKSDGDSIGSNTIVASNSGIGNLLYAANDGVNFIFAASILGIVDSNPGINSMPGALVFQTTSPNSNSPTPRMRITSNGDVLVGSATSTGTASQRLQVTGGAYVSGNLGLGVTNPAAATKFHIRDDATTRGRMIVQQTDQRTIVGAHWQFGVAQYAYIQGKNDAESGNTAIVLNPDGGPIGVNTIPFASNFDVFQSSETGCAIRAIAQRSPNPSALAPGLITAIRTHTASNTAYRAQFAACGIGSTSGEQGVYSFWPTFANYPLDMMPRRAADIVGGFSTSTWGTEYLSFHVGFDGASNDSAHLTREKLRIDGSGRLLIGITSSVAVQYSGESKVQIANTGIYNLSVLQYSNNAFESLLSLGKSRASSIGSHTIVQNNDALGSIRFEGSDGTGFITGAQIWSFAEGIAGISSMPARLSFGTTPAGLSYPIERARFTPAGYFKASDTGAYHDSTSGGTFHEFRTSISSSALVATASNASYAGNLYHGSTTRANNTGFNLLVLETSTFTDREFVLRGDGNAFADGTWTGGGADYAEYFEWSDSNPTAEDRRGISVVLDGDKIREAQDGEDPIGVISGNPSVVGDGAWNKWSGKYLRDDFGTYIREPHQVVEWEEEVLEEEEVLPVYDENDQIISPGRPAKYKTVKHSYEDFNIPSDVVVPSDAVYKSVDENGDPFTHRKLNPDYDPNMEYVPREERPEWDCVGLMGKLRVRKGQIIGSRWIKMRDISDSVEEWLVR